MFSVDEALDRAAGKKEKKWRNKSKSNVDIDARFANPDALRIAIDVSYEQDSTRARRSVAKQLCECVGVSRRNDDVALTYCAWRGPIAEESREYFFSDRWDCVRKDERDVEHVFLRDDIVYMSPDAEDALDDVDASKVYVVGGIVDLATRGMRTSVARATNAGFRAVRLPIREYRPDQTHTVLNIDAVVKILAARRSGLSWDETFARELPKRQNKERPKREKRERSVDAK
jgi:Trm5-related predicted tRNA methylase